VLVIKAGEDHGLRDDWRLVRAFVPRFGRLRRFWLSTAPALAVPGPVARAVADVRRRRQGPSAPLSSRDVRTTVTASVPPTMLARRMVTIRVHTRNDGPVRLASTAPRPVHLSYRWFREGEVVDEDESLRTQLTGGLGSGSTTTLDARVLTPWAPGRYELRVSLVQEFVAWFDELDPEYGARFDVDVQMPEAGA
jgi:hypothetical protein